MARQASPPPARLLPTILLALFAVSQVHATIFVPEEIPSLLSVIYSNLPPVKKGTDSRLGVGFRLGPNADVQFQLELGPQSNTVPIGAGAAEGAAQKRHAVSAQGAGGGGGGRGKPKDWLNAWRLQMSPGYVPDDYEDDGGRPSATGSGADDTPSGGGVSDTVAHLRQLYKPQPVAA